VALKAVIDSQATLEAAVASQKELFSQADDAAIVFQAALDAAIISKAALDSAADSPAALHSAIDSQVALDAAVGSRAAIFSEAEDAAVVSQAALEASKVFLAALDTVILSQDEAAIVSQVRDASVVSQTALDAWEVSQVAMDAAIILQSIEAAVFSLTLDKSITGTGIKQRIVYGPRRSDGTRSVSGWDQNGRHFRSDGYPARTAPRSQKHKAADESDVESGWHTDSSITEEGSETPPSMDMSEGEEVFKAKRIKRRSLIFAEAKARRNARALVRRPKRAKH
jgi:hypothetical protein